MPYRIYLGNYVSKAGPVTPPGEQVSSIGIPLTKPRRVECSMTIRWPIPEATVGIIGPALATLSFSPRFSLGISAIASLAADVAFHLRYDSTIWLRRRLAKYLPSRELRRKRESDMRDDEEDFGEQA